MLMLCFYFVHFHIISCKMMLMACLPSFISEKSDHVYFSLHIFFLFFPFLLTFNVKNKENVATEKDWTWMQKTLQCFDIYRCLCQNIIVLFCVCVLSSVGEYCFIALYHFRQLFRTSSSFLPEVICLFP